jgi:coenzyme F420 hydrogenase subunit beta
MSEKLEREVWTLERCAGCGLCVATCSKGMLYWAEDEHPLREVREKALGLSHTPLDSCTFCQRFCEETCPRLREWTPLEIKRLVTARAVGVVNSGEPGDVIKNLLTATMASGLIDGVLLADMNPWTLQPEARVVTSVGEIASTLGVQYIWTPVLSALNDAIFKQGVRNLAIVGTPCAAEAIRALFESENERLQPYRDAIRLTISPFCMGVFAPALVSTYLAEALGTEPGEVRQLVALPSQDKMMAVLWDGTRLDIPTTAVQKYTRRGCASCDDYLGESADIAVGTVGAAEGYSTVIARSTAGVVALQHALNFGLLETGPAVDQAALDKAKADKERRERAQAFEGLLILTLDAFQDPAKRVEACREFERLYGTPQRAEVKIETMKEAGCVACSGC